MATTRFNANILAASRRLQQNRTQAGPAGDSGNRYTSARLSDYQNRAIRDLVRAGFEKGADLFALRFPQMLKTSDLIAVDGLSTLAIPSSVWLIVDAWLESKKLKRIPDHRIADVRSGVDRLIVPSATEPAYYIENGGTYFLPAPATGNLYYRFVQEHTDIVVSTAASGVGNKNTANGTFTAATKTLTAAMTIAFASADVGKRVIFSTVNGIGGLTGVYESLIYSQTSATAVVLGGSGDYLPIADETVSAVLVSDYTPDISDIILSRYEDGAIIDLMVQYAMQDKALQP